MRRILATLLLTSTAALAQANLQPVPANLLIPRPPPSAPIADWTPTANRALLTEPLPGTTLRGWEYKAPTPNAPLLLFFNGNGMTIDRSDSLYRDLAAQGAHLFVYDYRGIGFSTGTPDVMTFRQDALHLYDAVAAAHPGAPVVVYGFSLGTAMASYVASQRKVSGLILAGTIAGAVEEFPVYLRAVGVAPEVIATLTPAPESLEAFDEVGNIRQSSAPLLMLHGEADTLVPIAQGREVFAASPSPHKRFVSLPATTHNQTAGTAQAIRAVAEFLASLKAAPSSGPIP